ncbi:MAG TPA: hypothetical protein VNQ34_06055 [Xanthobacteraceae bacterium]|nr:hypothetical protein [Xanthobacteraceae bacterium]
MNIVLYNGNVKLIPRHRLARHGHVRAAARIRSPGHAGLTMTESMAALRKFD